MYERDSILPSQRGDPQDVCEGDSILPSQRGDPHDICEGNSILPSQCGDPQDVGEGNTILPPQRGRVSYLIVFILQMYINELNLTFFSKKVTFSSISIISPYYGNITL